jgi:hypothetical protein
MLRWLFILGMLLSFSIGAAEAPAFISGMSIQPSPTFTRITFIMSKKTVGHVVYSSNPDKVTVEFANTQKNFTMQQAQLLGSVVTSITTDNIPGGSLRFTLLTKGKVRWKTVYLPKDKKGIVRWRLDVMMSKTKK